MAVNVLSAAKMLCEESDWQLCNLSLQKILYIAHMVYMGNTQGNRLIDQTFEAWDYGPVNPTLYQRVNMFGDKPIKNIFRSVPDLDQDSPEAEVLKQACKVLKSTKPAQLVAITHADCGAWSKSYTGSSIKYPLKDADILNEFQSRFQ